MSRQRRYRVVAPFFGGQMLVGYTVQTLGIGTVLALPQGVDKNGPERLLW